MDVHPLSFRRLGGVALGYALLLVVMTMPAPFRLGQGLIGNNVDNWIFYWNAWWLREALREGRSPLFTPYLFFPHGASLAAHSNSFLDALLSLPLTPFVGPMAAYNLVWLLDLWVGAMGAFLLVYALTGSGAGAWMAGFIFTFAPYHLTQALAHAHLGGIHWWPWYILCLQRALALRRCREALGAGVFAALTLWTGLQLAVMLALWTAAYFLARGPRRWREEVGTLIIVAAVAVGLSLPLLLPVARQWQAAWTAGFDEGMTKQTDLLAYLVPPTLHPLWGRWFVPCYERFIANRAYMPYAGYGVLGLAGLGLAAGGRRALSARFWFLTLVGWLVLAAGDAPRWNGRLLAQVPLPYRWLGQLFPFSTLRSPDRFNLLVVLTLAILAGYGAAYMAWRHRGWLLPLGLLVWVEYVVLPLPMWEPLPASPFYEQMARETARYGVLDYPLGYTQGKLWLYYQTLHHKPIVEGHVSRYTPDLYRFILGNSLLRTLYRATLTDKPPLLPEDAFTSRPLSVSALGPALRDLTDVGVRYLLLHKPYADEEARAYLRRVLPLAPVYEDETLAVYDLTAPLAVSYDGYPRPLDGVLALARFDVWREGGSWRALLVGVASEPSHPVACTLRLAGSAWPPTAFTFFDEAEVTWRAGDLDAVELTLDGGPLPSGTYRWVLECDGKMLASPGVLYVPSQGEPLYARGTPEATFGPCIRLRGYRRRTEGAELRLTLTWEALCPPGEDLFVFVHLLDGQGDIVAQYDGMPCGWGCPTSAWEAGQRVDDDGARVPLWDVPAGVYRLVVGLYRPDGSRLPVLTAEGVPLSDAAFILSEPFTVTRALRGGEPRP